MKNNVEWIEYKVLNKIRPELFSKSNDIEIVMDEDIIAKFEFKNNVLIGVLYKSNYNYFVVDLVRVEGKLYAYERLIPVNINAVVTVAVLNDKLIMLKQYRHPNRKIEYSFPRGYGEKLLSGEDNAKKELFEEIGARTTNVEKLGKLSPDSGVLSNYVEVYYCELEQYKKKYGYEGIQDIILLSVDEVKEWIKSGEITDNFTISAFYLYLDRK